MLYLELLFVVLLTLTNGFLALSELAVVSARRSRLRHLAEHGDRGARAALRLIDDPSRFLATVQVGITLIGVLAGAFGSATLADRLGDWLDGFPALAPNGDTIGIGIVVIAITYLSIVVGELVPKRMALTNPERMGAFVARPMSLLSRLAAPAVWLLKTSTEGVLRVIGLARACESSITEDEVKSLIAEGTRAGIFAPQEREMVEGVLRLADRAVRVIMTPRSEIAWIDVAADRATIDRIAGAQRFSALLVCEGSVDQVAGSVHSKALLPVALEGGAIDLKSTMKPILAVLDSTPVLTLLNRFRRERLHMAVVVDEYGVTEGMVTLTDVLEAIAGEFPEPGEELEMSIVKREDGSWLADGAVPLDELEDRLQLPDIRAERQVDTLAGFVLQRLGHLPAAGESFVYRGLRFEVVDMDRRRIDKVAIRREG